MRYLPHTPDEIKSMLEAIGAASIDDTNTVRAARRLIDQRIPVSAADLADSAKSLRALLKATR